MVFDVPDLTDFKVGSISMSHIVAETLCRILNA